MKVPKSYLHIRASQSLILHIAKPICALAAYLMLSNFSDTLILAILVSSYKIAKIGYINLVIHGQTAFLLFIMGGEKGSGLVHGPHSS